MVFFFFFFNQKTAYEMRISDWSSDVCSSDLTAEEADVAAQETKSAVDVADKGSQELINDVPITLVRRVLIVRKEAAEPIRGSWSERAPRRRRRGRAAAVHSGSAY